MSELRPAIDAIDHIVFATPDLLRTVEWFAEMSGVTPVFGGSHEGVGTANYLVGLGGERYLEIIGPDPGQPEPLMSRPFGIDQLTAARVASWATAVADAESTIAAARAVGYDPGESFPMGRVPSDGEQLAWRLTPPPMNEHGGVAPFLIEWGTTPHPTTRDLPTVELASFSARTPEPAAAQVACGALGLELAIEPGEQPAFGVTLTTGYGSVRLD